MLDVGRDFLQSPLHEEWERAGGFLVSISILRLFAGMMERSRREGLHNIHGFVGTGEDTVVCEGCADIVFFGIDLHDFSDQRKVLANAQRMLNAGGRLVVLDWKKEVTP